MSNLSEKLHALITRVTGGKVEVAIHEVENVVTEVTAHINTSVIPAIEAKLAEVVPAVVQEAVSKALQAERAEAERIAATLEATYQKFVKEYGSGAANAAMGGAVAPEETQKAADAVVAPEGTDTPAA